jgi:polyphosphate kinase
MVTRLSSCFELGEGDLIEGGRYHNLNDLAGLPVGDLPELEYGPLDPLPHPTLEGGPSSLDLIRAKDRLLHFPYQSYSYVVRLLKEAAADPDVDAIWISLYRVSRDSEVVKALIEAAENGKEVMAFVEVQARFDEELNLEWAERMELAGIRVIHGTREIKVHAKLCLIRRREGDVSRLYALLATGNFNEKTARVYADHALMTADPRLTEEVRRVFRLLCGEDVQPDFEHLLVAPHHLRDRFNALIDAETVAARQGRPSGITAKMNSLQDRGIIDRLYDASAAGVPVRLVIRGICCLRPGVEGLSDSIEATSIVDRFLEHSRMFLFHADGAEKMYLSSADWMTRNLNRRVEVAFPIYDQDVFDELRHVLALQCADNTKARIIDEHQRNRFVQEIEGATVRSQFDTYRYLRELLADHPGS